MKKIAISIAVLTVMFSSKTLHAQAEWRDGSGAIVNTVTTNIYRTDRVSIGTATPTFPNRLHVFSNTTANEGTRITNQGTGAGTLFLENTGSGGRNWGLFSSGSGNTPQGGAGNFFLFDMTSGATRFYVKGSNGFIGMNTVSPLQHLHVNGNFLIDGAYSSLFFGADVSGSHQYGEYGAEHISISGKSGLNFWKPFGSHFQNGTSVGATMNYVLFLNDDGRVGVNTDNPTAQFTVNGKTLIGDPAAVNINTTTTYSLYAQHGVLTSKVRVAVVNSSNWADYVFEKDYRLRPLNEVEQFIAVNKHLPEVPSACEVEANGVDMAEMDATLLKKIEELTLYVISQEKQIGQMKREIEQLKKDDSND